MKSHLTPYLFFLWAIALICCLGRLPNDYYTLVYFVTMVLSAYYAYCYFKEDNVAIGFTFVALALIFQPFFKISMNKCTWIIIDIVVAMFLVSLAVKKLVERNKNVPSAVDDHLPEIQSVVKSRTFLAALLVFFVLSVIFFGAWYAYKHRLPPRTNPRSSEIVDKQYQFNDVNSFHLQVAKKNGIKPVQKRSQIDHSKLKKLETCDYYAIDKLTHSVPYLIPTSKTLLDEIGEGFQKELAAQGYRKHRIIVSSVLRTKEDVENLGRNNVNASKNSAHLYATTFDLSYVRFERTSKQGEPVNNQTMANILGGVLKGLRDKGRCYIKFERNQRCFHITSR